jgi:MFS family permease
VRRLILLVSAIVLLDTAFYSAVAPLLPHYVDEFDLSKSAAGVLTGSFAAGSLAGAIPGGWLAGRLGVKPTTLIGLALLAVSSLVFGFAREVWLLDAARFAQGVSSACTWAACFAWVVERAPAERRGEVIGTPLAAAIAGALLGPVIGTAADAAGPETVFAIVAALAVLLALPAAREPARPGGATDLRRVAVALRTRSIQAGIWLVALPALAAGVVNVLVPLRMDELGAAGAAIGAAYLVAAALEAAISPVVGRVSDRRGRLAPMRLGFVVVTAAMVLLPLPASALAVAALFVAMAVGCGAFWAPAMALLSDNAESIRVQQGFAFAFTNIAWSTGQLVGNGGGGALADATADWVSYALVVALFMATSVALARAPRLAAG